MLQPRALRPHLAALALSLLASRAVADPNHQGQTGVSTIATTASAQPPQPVAAPQPVAPPQPVGYVPPPPVTATGPTVFRPVQQPLAQPAPPPDAGPMLPSQQQRNAEARPGFFGSVQGGAAIPVQGDLGTYGSIGGVGFIQGGFEVNGGFSARLELGFRTNTVRIPSSSSTLPDAETAITYGAGFRYTFARTAVLHPFIEVYADLFSPIVSQSSGPTTGATTAGTGFSAGGGAGLELDLNELISVQLSGRYDEVISNASATAMTGGLMHVLVGGTYYY